MAESAKEPHPVKAFGLASRDSSGILSPFNFSVRATGEKDVKLKVLYCGICHTDLHQIRNDWGNSIFPMVPGHEVVGRVMEIGDKVEKKFKVGDNVGVGSIVGSCNSCDSCSQDLENYCPDLVLTYNSLDDDGHPNYGGYSNTMVVNEHFVVKIPEGIALEACAPLLCAGITTYSPMKHFGLDKAGMRLGVVGLGGLGHVAVKFAKAFGAQVTVISSSPGKKAEAVDRLGADSFLVSSDAEEMQAAMGSMDGIIDTVSASHAMMPLVGLLKTQGKLVIVGLPEKPLELPVFPLIMGRKMVVGSLVGGMTETQEMLDFAAENGITADIELISCDYVNTAMDRLAKGDVRYRFVIDIANTLTSTFK